MTWARFDDGYDDHPKVMAATHAEPLAAALHAQAITASARRESDGLVDPYWLLAKAPNKRKREAVLELLVGLRLYDVLPAGEAREFVDGLDFEVTVGPFDGPRYLVHDFLGYNPSSAQLADRRRRDAERKAVGRRAESDEHPDGVRADSNGSPLTRGSAGAGPQPGPSRPSTSQPPGEAQGERADVARLSGLLAELMTANDEKAKTAPTSKGWMDPIRLLLDRDGRTEAEVERLIRWSQQHEFWRSNVLSPAKLRKQANQLKLRMEAEGLRDSMGKPAPPSSSAIGAALAGVRREPQSPRSDQSSRTGVR